MTASVAAVVCWVCCSAVADSAGVAPCQVAVEVCHFSFENEGSTAYDGDKDYDGQPDDWTRRKGPGFPHYVKASIDRSMAFHGQQSLRFQVNGGQVALYSPINDLVGPIDPHYSYVLRGRVRTQSLQHDAALISVSLLNHRRERVQRFLTRPVSGTHQDWVEVTLGPMVPLPDARFAVIGCHLVHDGKMDFQGDVWFDDLWLGRLPRLSLSSNFATHFKEEGRPIEIKAAVSGLDERHQYQLRLELEDGRGRRLAQKTVPYRHAAASGTSGAPGGDRGMAGTVGHDTVHSSERMEMGQAPNVLFGASPMFMVAPQFSEVWQVPPQELGFYRVRAILDQDEVVVLSQETSVAVMDLVATKRAGRGEFGWIVSRELETSDLSDLALIASEAGINWLKLPLWKSATSADAQRAVAIAGLLESLSRCHISPVGLLHDPPEKLKARVAHDWRGMSQVFSMPPEFWSPFLEPVVARYSPSVRHWQLGSDDDSSFQGMERPNDILPRIQREFDRVGRATNVGIPWDWNAPTPPTLDVPQTFLSFGSALPLSAAELTQRLTQRTAPRLPHWVVLKPLPRSAATDEARAADLTKRMLAAKIGRAEAIFASDVFDPEYGILGLDGSPQPLFLPWRTTAVTLQGAAYLGSLRLSGGSTNHLFARDGQTSLVVWNDKETTEEISLGETVVVSDLWGRCRPLRRDATTRGLVLDVGPVPLTLRGCSEPLARWCLAAQFELGRARSEYGGHEEALVGVNAFPQGVNGTVSLVLPRDWEAEPRSWTLMVAKDESFRLPMILTLPPDANLGTATIQIEFDIVADRRYQFRVERPYQVGLGDISLDVVDRKLDDGRLEIEQTITNQTDPPETLNFRCHLYIPGHRRQKQVVTKLSDDKDRKFYYIPDAEQLRGKELRLRAEQIDGRRVLNKRWIVGGTWDSPARTSQTATGRTLGED